jgi:hypothetical protein
MHTDGTVTTASARLPGLGRGVPAVNEPAGLRPIRVHLCASVVPDFLLASSGVAPLRTAEVRCGTASCRGATCLTVYGMFLTTASGPPRASPANRCMGSLLHIASCGLAEAATDRPHRWTSGVVASDCICPACCSARWSVLVHGLLPPFHRLIDTGRTGAEPLVPCATAPTRHRRAAPNWCMGFWPHVARRSPAAWRRRRGRTAGHGVLPPNNCWTGRTRRLGPRHRVQGNSVWG